MTFKRFGSRLKAAVLAAAMAATTFISPAAYQMTQVWAAGTTEEVGLVLEASASTDEEAPNKGRIAVPSDTTTVTLNFSIDAGDKVESISMEIFGAELNADPWWANISGGSFDLEPEGGKASYTFDIPASGTNKGKTVPVQGSVRRLAIGLWYPKKNVTVTVDSITHDGTPGLGGGGNKEPGGPQTKPETENSKSGTYTFTDNKDGTATITSTLTAEINDPKMDIILTAGYDEESYLDDETMESTYKPGDPINSQKFSFEDFGLEDISELTIQSFNYTITADEIMDTFQYGGGINVEKGKPADTECHKVDKFGRQKDGYWYNDQGEEDMELYGDLFEITPHGAYKVENAGDYAEVVWDVPQEVQPYVSKNNVDTVGFQFWYADALNPHEGEDYSAVESIHLKAASCTYTRTMTVPYTNTDSVKIGGSLKSGGSPVKIDLSKLGLDKNRCFGSAIKFNVSSSADLTKLQAGIGISVSDSNPIYGDDGWYMPKTGLTVLEPTSKGTEIMWIIPEEIRRDVYYGSGGNAEFAVWYAGDENGESSASITLDSIDVYEFITQEEDLVVSPPEFEITVGEEKQLDINVPGCKFEVTNDEVVSVSSGGLVTGLGPGLTAITVKTPEGQETDIIVRVKPEPTEPPTTTTKATTTKKITTTAEPTTIKQLTPDDINWDKVLYGDVNVDSLVNIADIVALNMYLLNSKEYPLKNATAKENADCIYDYETATSDSTIIMNCVAEIVAREILGPQAGDKIHESWPPEDWADNHID